jgi:amino acid adenylation domain-containing protein
MTPLFSKLFQAIQQYDARAAAVLNEVSYSYGELGAAVSTIRAEISRPEYAGQTIIGLATNDDLYTYAGILALWFEGKAYVPLNPAMPAERNQSIMEQAEIKTILGQYSLPAPLDNIRIIDIPALPKATENPAPKGISDEELAYILFTSGTTGTPKGVPITRGNLGAFIDAMDALDLDIDSNDRCLQMFELTFDFSVAAYVLPFTRGASIYTIPKEKIKYGYIYELLDEQDLTVLFLVPSVLHYLKPHFDEMHFPRVKYSIFCGEALTVEITEAWSICMPHMKTINFYGPTECTVFCTQYPYHRDGENKQYNGILSIGKPMQGTEVLLIDEADRPLGTGQTGELCLAGIQLTPGYWKDDAKNAASFFYHDGKRFYRTGDLCRIDEDGDIFYVGRADSQVKVQGFRIELSEIEFHCKAFLKEHNLVTVPFQNKIGNIEIGLVIESAPFDTEDLFEYLKPHLPSYMVPTQVQFERSFPLNINGKTDRKKLKEKFVA